MQKDRRGRGASKFLWVLLLAVRGSHSSITHNYWSGTPASICPSTEGKPLKKIPCGGTTWSMWPHAWGVEVGDRFESCEFLSLSEPPCLSSDRKVSMDLNDRCIGLCTSIQNIALTLNEWVMFTLKSLGFGVQGDTEAGWYLGKRFIKRNVKQRAQCQGLWGKNRPGGWWTTLLIQFIERGRELDWWFCFWSHAG